MALHSTVLIALVRRLSYRSLLRRGGAQANLHLHCQNFLTSILRKRRVVLGKG